MTLNFILAVVAVLGLLTLQSAAKHWHHILFVFGKHRTIAVVEEALSEHTQSYHLNNTEKGLRWRGSNGAQSASVHVYTKSSPLPGGGSEVNVTEVLIRQEPAWPLDLEISHFTSMLEDDEVADGLPSNVLVNGTADTTSTKLASATRKAIGLAVGDYSATVSAGAVRWSGQGLPNAETFSKIFAACWQLANALKKQAWPSP